MEEKRRGNKEMEKKRREGKLRKEKE